MRLIVVLFGALLFGCATLGGTRQYVSIDSEPRGLVVTDYESAETLGTTPFFVELGRRRAQRFLLRAPDSDLPHALAEICEYRWLPSLGANGLLAAPAALLPPLALALWGTGAGVDLATGAAWECPETFFAQTRFTLEPLPLCPVHLIAPPRHADERLSRLLTRRWAETLEGCASVVAEEEAALEFARIGIDHRTGLELEEIPRARLNALGHRSGATHIVLITELSGETLLGAKTELYDLHSLQLVSESTLELDTNQESVSSSSFLRWLGRSVSLVPNAVAFAPSVKEYTLTPRGQTESATVLFKPPFLPSVLTNWTMFNVDVPGRHRTWDASFGLSPGASVGMHSLRLDLDGAERKITAFRALALYGPHLTLHTPLGALSARLSLGAGITPAWDEGFRGFSPRLYFSAEASWTAFLTSRLFIRLSLVGFSPHASFVSTDRYALENWQQLTFHVGWHLPQLRSWVRDLF